MSEAPESSGPTNSTDARAPSSTPSLGGPSLVPASSSGQGPDPVIGAGITLLGIFMMGVAGAAGAHYAFNVGTLVACVGAVVFVLFVALSALKQRKATANGG